MQRNQRKIWMWVLYSALFAVTILAQTVFFGKPRFWGVKVSLIPVCVACVAMHCGAEAGAIFGLCCGTVWCFAGADGGALYILLLTGCGMLAGYLCDRYLVRTLASALGCCLISLFLCLVVIFIFKCYIGEATIRGLLDAGKQLLLSVLFTPFFYLAAWAIGKAGAQ